MKPRKPLTATALRLILTGSLLLIAGITAGGFYFFNSQLQTVASSVSRASADARASQDNLQTLQKIQKDLRQNQDVVQRATSIVAESQSYRYQDQIVTDLNGYATRAGISIVTIDFSVAGGSASTALGGAKAATPAPTTTTPAPAGAKATSASITINSPVDYYSLLRFIRSIEQNLTKMQISKVALTKGTSGSSVTSEAFTIEVYIH